MKSKCIKQGGEYLVENLQTSNTQTLLQCTGVIQRNWTRVGSGIATDLNGYTHSRYFLKQNIDRSGYWHPNHWDHEQHGAIIAWDLLHGIVRVPELRYQNKSHLLNVFDYIDVVTVDELLRTDAALFHQSFAYLLERVIGILEAMRQPRIVHLSGDIPMKHRTYGGPSDAINFKGFEIRNMGFTRMSDGRVNTRELVAFDFVRPYLAPIEEAAAKLFVSIGLLNWGKPLGRFALGPDVTLLEQAKIPLGPYLDKQAIRSEIDLQFFFRMREFQGSGILERSLKKIGIETLGRLYFSKLRRWCDQN